MRVTCPACGAELSLDALLTHDEARRAVAAAMQISAPLASRLMKYLALFRPAQRQLTMERVASLLNELLPTICDARAQRGGRVYIVDVETWKQALDTVLAARDAGTLRVPLRSHGYLVEVATAMVEKYEAGEEERRERVKRQAHRDLPATGNDDPMARAIWGAEARRIERELEHGPTVTPRAVPAESKQVLEALGFRRRSPSPPPSPPDGGEGEGGQS